MKKINVTINEDGTIEMDLDGFRGKGCSDITKAISDALGTVKKTDKKCDYHKQPEKETQKINNQ